MIRTLIVEESRVARLGIRSLLGRHAQALEIDEVDSRTELLARLRERYYEFIILEPAFSGQPDPALLRELCKMSPWSAVLVFTELDELTYGVDAIRDGAKGYLMKSAGRDEFLSAVKRVGSGQIYLSKALAAEFATGLRKYDSRSKPHEAFSKREFQVFSMAVCGMTTLESAHILQMSTDAIRLLKDGVMGKLRAATRDELVAYAMSHGLMLDCRSTSSLLWTSCFGQDYVARPETRSSMFFA